MLTFIDGLPQLLATAALLALGLLIAVIQRPVFHVCWRVSGFLFAWHTAFCLIYLYWSFNTVVDATTYYLVSTTYSGSLGLGTQGIYWLTSLLSQGCALSYGNTFLAYQLFGFIGTIACFSAFRPSNYQPSNGQTFSHQQSLGWVCILLPGLSFWSSALGKDGIAFMGAGLASWAAIQPRERYFGWLIAVIATTFVRPHIGAILMISATLAVVFGTRLNAAKHMLLAGSCIVVTLVTVSVSLDFLGFAADASTEELTEFFERRQSHNLGGGSSIPLGEMPMAARLFSFLYRPMFFDTAGLFGICTSAENLILLGLTLRFIATVGKYRSSLPAFAKYFFVIYTSAMWFVLGNTTANLGLASRQKWMFLPMLLAFFLSYSRARLSVHSRNSSLSQLALAVRTKRT